MALEVFPQFVDTLLEEYERKFGKISIDEEVVNVMCPKCGKTKALKVDRVSVLESRNPIYEFPVYEGDVCEHSFFIGIDSSFKQR